MAKRRVIVELAHSRKLDRYMAAASTPDMTLSAASVPQLAGIELDASFPAIPIPGTVPREQTADPFDTAALFDVDDSPKASTFLVRGTVDEKDLGSFETAAERSRSVVGVYADVAIQPCIVCPGSPAVGTDATVERLLCVDRMHRSRMDGTGVLVAIVDTGVNVAYLNGKGKTPTFDATRSWAWDPAVVTPGDAPVGHGTMCAFDVCIAAPKCTLLDIALLHPISAAPGESLMDGLLSDAIRAYRHLLSVMTAPQRPGELRSLVVNNSWGMFHPSWDWPVGHPGNYSDNPNHPFNRIVATLDRAGADILFAAGNCGADCPDGRCQGVTTRAIYGANSSAAVTCVAGADTTKARVGYSAIGPGRLVREKPDITGYTHFQGSGVYPADGGTSAACPVVSGVVAAVRSKRPYDPANAQTHPSAIRNLLTSTAEDRGAAGYDFLYGHGIVNGCELHRRLTRPFDICRRYPWICDRRWWWWWRFRRPTAAAPPAGAAADDEPPPEDEVPPEGYEEVLAQVLEGSAGADYSTEELAYMFGRLVGAEGEEPSAAPAKGGCSCEGAEGS